MTGNKAVIDALNFALEVEWTASEVYLLQARQFEVWGLPDLASKWRDEAAEEREHSRKLVDRITFLEGTPTAVHCKRPNLPDEPPKLAVPALLEADLAIEEDGLARYRDGVTIARARGDETSAGLMAVLLDQTESHVLMLESSLIAIDSMGIDNWLASFV